MDDAVNGFFRALECRLRALQLAGVRRVPRLWPEAPAPVAAGASPSAGVAASAVDSRPQFGSMAEFARQMRERLGVAGGGAGASKAAPGRSSGSRGAAETPRPAAEPEAGQGLPPRRPADAGVDAQLASLAATVARCTRCAELAASRTQTVFADGPSNAELMFVGEAPGQDEDARGVPFVGRAGQLLTKIITAGMGMRREDVYICNILKCRPPGNRNPAPDEAAHCREYLDKQIELVAPKVICCLGGVASRFLLDDATPVGQMRGQWRQYRGIPVRVTYHPAYLLRNYTVDARQKVWDDVREVAAKLRELRG